MSGPQHSATTAGSPSTLRDFGITSVSVPVVINGLGTFLTCITHWSLVGVQTAEEVSVCVHVCVRICVSVCH